MTLVLPLVVLAAACARNPATGERQLVLVPESQAKTLGANEAQQIVQTIGVVDDARLEAYVARIGKAMAAKSERPELEWTFQVLDDPSVNAFALPGGHVFVTRGLLAYLGSEAELAAVMGHEIGHVTAKHSVNQMSKAKLTQLGLGLGSAVSEDFAKVAPLGAAGLQLLFLKYGRDDEYQADELGVRYASRAGYDVREMPKVFEALQRSSEASGGGGGGGALPEWLSTHPNPENRIERIRSHIAEVKSPGGEVQRAGYLRTVDGVVYGNDPTEGYFKENRFIHPALRFEITFPSGWKTSNGGNAVSAQSPAGDAAEQLALVEQDTPEAALQSFGGKEGIELGARLPDVTAGAQSVTARFQARTDGGALGGLVTFVSHEGKTLAILGVAKQEQVEAYLPAFEATARSFAPVTDRSLLDVQPQRLDVVEVPRAMTLAELVQAEKPAVAVEEIARLNGLEPGARLERGQLVKLVRGGGAAR